jgi:hypothetical protein
MEESAIGEWPDCESALKALVLVGFGLREPFTVEDPAVGFSPPVR